MSIPFWLKWLVIFCCNCFFRVLLNFMIRMIMRQRSILHESIKKQISIFHSEKGSFSFIATVNYHICSILLYLNSIDVECFLSCLRKKKTIISGFWQTFFSSFGMEVIEESNPGESIGLKFISSQSELFLFIPISVSESIRIIPNQSEKRFVSRLMKNGQKSIRLNPVNSVTSIRMNPN